jgi:uncharacterized protein YecT (DUF1311 family)
MKPTLCLSLLSVFFCLTQGALAQSPAPEYRKLDCYGTGRKEDGVAPQTDFEKLKCLFIKGGHFYLDNNSATGSLKASLIADNVINFRITEVAESTNFCDVSFNVKVDSSNPNQGVSVTQGVDAKVTFAKDRIEVIQNGSYDDCGMNAYYGGSFVRPIEAEANFCRSVTESGKTMSDCIQVERDKADRIMNSWWQSLKTTYPKGSADWAQLVQTQIRWMTAADADCKTQSLFLAGAAADFERLACEARARVARSEELEIRYQQRPKPKR